MRAERQHSVAVLSDGLMGTSWGLKEALTLPGYYNFFLGPEVRHQSRKKPKRRKRKEERRAPLVLRQPVEKNTFGRRLKSELRGLQL